MCDSSISVKKPTTIQPSAPQAGFSAGLYLANRNRFKNQDASHQHGSVWALCPEEPASVGSVTSLIIFKALLVGCVDKYEHAFCFVADGTSQGSNCYLTFLFRAANMEKKGAEYEVNYHLFHDASRSQQ